MAMLLVVLEHAELRTCSLTLTLWVYYVENLLSEHFRRRLRLTWEFLCPGAQMSSGGICKAVAVCKPFRLEAAYFLDTDTDTQHLSERLAVEL